MPKRILILIAALMLALITACSSSSKKSGTTQSTPPAATTANSSASPPSGGGSVISASGDILTGAGGKTLYFNTVDTASKITCVGACATEWPPVPGPVTAVNGVDQSLFGTAGRPDGTQQVTFDGHPLYMFQEDSKAGDMKGEGVDDQGGKWHVATSSGTPVTGSSSDDHGGGSGGSDDSSAPPSGGASSSY